MRHLIGICAAVFAAPACLSASTVQAHRAAEGELERAAWPSPPSTGTATCEQLAAAVAQRHPKVQAARARASAALARARAEGELPPPRVSIEVWDFPIGDPGMADREGMYMLGVGQMIPAPGTRDALVRAETEESRAALAEVAESGRAVWAATAGACVEWSAAAAVHARLAGHRSLLLEMRDAMLARFQGGAESLGVVSRADAELATADRHMVEAEEELAITEATVRALAGDIAIPAAPPPVPYPTQALDAEALIERALGSRGDLEIASAKHRSAGARAEAMAAEASAPEFDLQATYMQMPSMRAGLGAMFSMTLPWLWGPAAARRDSAEHEVLASNAELDDREREIRVEVTRAAGRVKALQRSLTILVEREIPAANRAGEAERATMTTGDFNLASWILAAHALREAHVDEARTRGALAQAMIELTAAVGAPLGEVMP